MISVFYPASGPSSPADGSAAQTNFSDDTFANLRAGAGNSGSANSNPDEISLLASTTTDKYWLLNRLIVMFNTASLNDAATISSVDLDLYCTSKGTGLGTCDVDIVSSAPASNDNVVSGDFDSLGTTVYSSIAIGSISTGAYNTFALDASGIATISKTGVSKFGARLSWDTDNSFTGTWASLGETEVLFSMAEQSGTTQDPKLTVTDDYVPPPFTPKCVAVC